MAKKIKIDIDFNQDNALIAIACHKKDYWLAYQLNESLKLKFKRISDFGCYHPKIDQVLNYPIYYFTDPSSVLSWYLIGNYHPDGKLFTALRTTDYFILINGQEALSEADKVISELKKIKGILHAYQLETRSLKEFGNFLSDLELYMIDSLKKL